MTRTTWDGGWWGQSQEEALTAPWVLLRGVFPSGGPRGRTSYSATAPLLPPMNPNPCGWIFFNMRTQACDSAGYYFVRVSACLTESSDISTPSYYHGSLPLGQHPQTVQTLGHQGCDHPHREAPSPAWGLGCPPTEQAPLLQVYSLCLQAHWRGKDCPGLYLHGPKTTIEGTRGRVGRSRLVVRPLPVQHAWRGARPRAEGRQSTLDREDMSQDSGAGAASSYPVIRINTSATQNQGIATR